MSFLSQSAKNKLLDEAQQHLQQHLTKDPAMPGFLRSIYSALIRIFWKDFVQEFDSSVGDADGEGEQQEAELADLAAAPTIAMGMLQVLVVEARNLRPAQGIGTNPYVRGMLGHQVRRSKTAWSTLNPFWKCLMEFPVVSMKNTLDLEVMSQAPLFGGDTRLGYISVPLTDIIGQQDAQSSPASRYRRETLLGSGSRQCEVVLILDYKPLEQRKDRCVSGCRRRLCRRVAQFRAFFLYYYWPCDKSLFQMYLKEPICIFLLLLALCPFLVVRACFFTILLVCLCFPYPPDEYQIMEYILACKGTAIFTDGLGRTVSGFLIYYSCIRAGTCHSGGGPGHSLGTITVALDFYMEVLIWFACFVLLPRTVPFGSRIGTGIGVPGGAHGTADQMQKTHTSSQINMNGDAESGAIKGGRMKALLMYNLICFAICVLLFGCLSARDVLTTEPEVLDKVWQWRIPENFFWCRTIFGLLMSPFCMLLHPQTNKLLTHCTPTGYTRLGTLLRYRPSYHKLRKDKKTSPQIAQRQPVLSSHKSDEVADRTAANGLVLERRMPSKESELGSSGAIEAHEDPIADLQAAIRRLRGGALALGTGKLVVRAIGLSFRITGKIVSFEIRTVSYAVSVGLRAVDTGVTTSLSIASYIPGSTLALQMAGCVAWWTQCVGKATLSFWAGAIRCFPGGTTLLHALQRVLQTVGFWAAAAESGEDLPLLPGTERAEHLKLEAAARLAEMLTRAEQLSAREAAEWTAEAAHWCAVRPEITKIMQALKVQRPKFGSSIQRAFAAGDALGQSLWVTTRRLSFRLIAASSTLVRAFRRELKDLNEKAPDRAPGWKAAWEAYSMLFCSAVCEAFLELRPAKEGGMHRQISSGPIGGDRQQKDLPLMANGNGAGLDIALGSKRFQARFQATPRKSI